MKIGDGIGNMFFSIFLLIPKSKSQVVFTFFPILLIIYLEKIVANKEKIW